MSFKYISAFFAVFFAVKSTIMLVAGQLGLGLMDLIFALYFAYDFKTSRLDARLRQLEYKNARITSVLEKVTGLQLTENQTGKK